MRTIILLSFNIFLISSFFAESGSAETVCGLEKKACEEKCQKETGDAKKTCLDECEEADTQCENLVS